MERRTVCAVALTAVAMVLLAGAGFLVLVYSGEYNVAATRPHLAAVEWALATVMKHSVADHAEGIDVPLLADTALIQSGFQHFDRMCVTCHGAPGVERSEIGEGLLPRPPPLSEEVSEWKPAELFWILKHGIKMSGMPSFGLTHDDRTLWRIVAFLQRLPETDSSAYAELQQRWGTSDGTGAGAGAHEHGPAADAVHGASGPGTEHEVVHQN